MAADAVSRDASKPIGTAHAVYFPEALESLSEFCVDLFL